MKNLTLILTVLVLLAGGYTQASAQFMGMPSITSQDIQKMRQDQLQKFFTAIEKGDYNTVSKMLDNGMSPNAPHTAFTPLTLAAGKGHAEIVNLLLRKGADVKEGRKDNGKTALIAASESLVSGKSQDYLAIVRSLVFNKANLEAKDKGGNTPLIAASGAHHNNTKIIDFLLQEKANVNARNINKDTPLLRACYFGDTQTLKMLLDAGAEINAQNNDGATPLMIATVNGHVEAVKLLLEKGANPNLAAKDGMTALRYANGEMGKLAKTSKPNIEIAKLLEKYGAKK